MKLFQCFSFRDLRTSEIKLQLNSSAGGRLKQNKILCYFRRPHIPETETKHWSLKQPETVLAFAHRETEIKRLKRSPDRRQFCFISVLFHHVGLHWILF